VNCLRCRLLGQKRNLKAWQWGLRAPHGARLEFVHFRLRAPNFLHLKGGDGAAAAPEGVIVQRAICRRAIRNF